MQELLMRAEPFEDLNEADFRRVSAIGYARTLRAGEYLFLVGDHAGDFFVVTRGTVDLCFPMRLHGEVKDIAVESIGEGRALGWSALVKPYRFTLSARAAEPSEVVGFPRHALAELFQAEPRIGHSCLMRLSELIGIRLAMFQALWARELQRLAERPPTAR